MASTAASQTAHPAIQGMPTPVHLVRMDFMVPIAIRSVLPPARLVLRPLSAPAVLTGKFWIRSLAHAAALIPVLLALPTSIIAKHAIQDSTSCLIPAVRTTGTGFKSAPILIGTTATNAQTIARRALNMAALHVAQASN